MAELNTVGIALLSTTSAIDLNAVAETSIFIVPPGKTCILSHAFLKVDQDAGGDGVFTIGANGAETDFVGTQNGDNLDAADDVILMQPVPSTTPPTNKAYAAAVDLRLDVSTGAAASTTGVLYLFGFLY